MIVSALLLSCPEPAGKGAAEILGEDAATAKAESTIGLSFILVDLALFADV